MATKKTTKKQTKSKRSTGKKMTPMKKALRNKLTKRRVAPKKKVGPKKSALKTARGKSRSVDTVAVSLTGQGARAGEQPGDLQGLSNIASADSESVDELLEEGNTFEAEVVKGVEDAGDADEQEVRTHEVPEDDVPDEYLEKE